MLCGLTNSSEVVKFEPHRANCNFFSATCKKSKYTGMKHCGPFVWSKEKFPPACKVHSDLISGATIIKISLKFFVRGMNMTPLCSANNNKHVLLMHLMSFPGLSSHVCIKQGWVVKNKEH